MNECFVLFVLKQVTLDSLSIYEKIFIEKTPFPILSLYLNKVLYTFAINWVKSRVSLLQQNK